MGLGGVWRKAHLAELVNGEAFVPQTWTDVEDCVAYLEAKEETKAGGVKNKVLILKPSVGHQGDCIQLVSTPSSLRAKWKALSNGANDKYYKDRECVGQVYIADPLLFNPSLTKGQSQSQDTGVKFDIRIYCLMTNADPCRVLLFNTGLVRLATHDYVQPHTDNMDNMYMHLTNSSLNKRNKDTWNPDIYKRLLAPTLQALDVDLADFWSQTAVIVRRYI